MNGVYLSAHYGKGKVLSATPDDLDEPIEFNPEIW